MKTEKKYLKFYHDCMRTGRLTLRRHGFPYGGLCGSVHIGRSDLLELFIPSVTDDGLRNKWWAYGRRSRDYETRAREFSPLRQTIVLFMAAMNNEL